MLRDRGELTCGTVAVQSAQDPPAAPAQPPGVIIGYAAISPITLDSASPSLKALGLAPVAVHPTCQGRGLGATLCQAAIDTARASGAHLLVVLGEPAYYRRFGFVPANRLGLISRYDAGDAFQALPLADPLPARPAPGTLAQYSPAFDTPEA